MFYNIALFVHIVGVTMLFIALGIELIAYVSRRRTQNVEQIKAIGQFGAINGLLHPVSLLLILTGGIYMAATAGLFTQAWVLFALASTLLLPILGMIIDSPRTTIIHQLAMEAQSSTISPELCQRIKDPILGSWNIVGTVLAFWILFLMTTKPDVMGALCSLLVVLLLGFGATLPLWKKADVAGSFVVAEDVDQTQTRS